MAINRLKVGNWAVVENGEIFYGSHLDCPNNLNTLIQKDSWLVTEHPRCWYCHAPVPDEVQALLILRTDSI